MGNVDGKRHDDMGDVWWALPQGDHNNHLLVPAMNDKEKGHQTTIKHVDMWLPLHFTTTFGSSFKKKKKRKTPRESYRFNGHIIRFVWDNSQ